MFAPDRLLQRLDAGEIAIGTSAHSSAPELIELYAFCGFDFVFFDMMFTAIDWERAAYLISAARAAGITAVPRVQTYPWVPDTAGIDRAMLSNIARAVGIGASAVLYSASSVDEIEIAAGIGREYHRKIHLFGPATVQAEGYNELLGGPQLVIPLIESLAPFKRLDDICQIDGIRLIHLGLGDLSRELVGRVDTSHPDVLDAVKEASGVAKKHGVALWVNTGYLSGGPDAIVERIRWFADNGIQVVMVSQGTMMLQEILRGIIARVRA
jgi:4-hydroxy-2-oxoheptanedioate aldolase